MQPSVMWIILAKVLNRSAAKVLEELAQQEF